MKKTAYYLFVFSLIFAPVAFGTAELWSQVILQISVLLALLLLTIDYLISRKDMVAVPGLTPLLLLNLYLAAQLIPLPIQLLQLISPNSVLIYGVIDNGTAFLPISINQKATLMELFRLMGLTATYILTIQLLRSPEKIKSVLQLVVFCGAVIAFFAILQQFSSDGKIYWIRSVPENANPMGPWINPNQFAGYIELLFPLALALFLFYKPRHKFQESFSEKLVSIFTMPSANKYLFLGFATILMVLAVVVSLCRGGILTISTMFIMFFALYAYIMGRKEKLFFLLLSALILLGISWLGWDTLITEFSHGAGENEDVSSGRFTLWADSLQMILVAPVLGSGFGSFLYLYPLYKTIDGDIIFDHAHNEYLELITDGGLIAFVLAAWFVIAVIMYGFRMVKKRRDPFAKLIGIGAIVSLTGLLLHCLTDFQMHNMAIAFYFFFICGVLVTSVNGRFANLAGGSLLGKYSSRTKYVFSVMILSAFAVVLCFQSSMLFAQLRYNEVKNIYISSHLSKELRLKAINGYLAARKFDPFEALYSYALANAVWFQGENNRALELYKEAVRKNPMEGAFLQRVGLLTENDELKKNLVEVSYDRALIKGDMVINLAEFLLVTESRLEAIELLRKHAEKDPKFIHKILPLIDNFSFSRDEVEQLLPKSVQAWINYGKIMLQLGEPVEASYYVGRSLDFLNNENQQKPTWFMQVISFYRQNGEPAKALTVLRLGVEALPKNAQFRIMLGDYYRQEGIVYRAKDEYEQALIHDPGNKQAISALRKMGFKDSY